MPRRNIKMAIAAIITTVMQRVCTWKGRGILDWFLFVCLILRPALLGPPVDGRRVPWRVPRGGRGGAGLRKAGGGGQGPVLAPGGGTHPPGEGGRLQTVSLLLLLPSLQSLERRAHQETQGKDLTHTVEVTAHHSSHTISSAHNL